MSARSVCLALALSCQRTRPAMTEEELSLAQRMSGSWEMEFQLLHSPLIAFDTALGPRMIKGTLALVINSSLNSSFPDVGIPANYGSYDLDLTSFGFDPRVSGMPPTAVVGRLSGDSIAIVFSPENGHGEMLLVGRLRDGRVDGTWRVSLERSTGDGVFVFRRPSTAVSK